VVVSNVAISNSTEVINLSILKKEIAVHLSNNERTIAYQKYKQLALNGDIDSLVAIADLSNDKSFEYYSEKTAYYYYIDAVKNESLKAYEPLIMMLIDRESQFYDLNKASLYASSYYAKAGEGSESLLGFVLWLNKFNDFDQISALAHKGFKKKQSLSVLVLGHLYEEGLGVEVNYVKSLKYFLNAKALGFEVDGDLSRVEIKRFSPQIGDFILYGSNKADVRDMFKRQGGILHNAGQLDIFKFDVNANSLSSATLMYSSNHQLGGLKYVFNDDDGRYESLKSSFFETYGPVKSNGKKIVWNKSFIQISLFKKEHCFEYCDGDDKQFKVFVEVAYIFKNVDVSLLDEGDKNASNFKF
jgi:hypothetical protein